MSRRSSRRSVTTQLLNTKLYMPAASADHVARPRLEARLQQAERYRLTLVSAPPGFGKTSLLAAWCARVNTMRVAWLSLEASDDDPTRFLLYVCAALQTVDPQLGAGAAMMLRASPSVAPQFVLTTLLNSLAERVEPVALVLDDAHVLESEAVNTLLAFLVEHCPPSLHLILTTRADPDLPLARYRARGYLNELRAHDLRFTSDEAATFLNAVMDLHLTRGEMQALETRTEGWIAGLQLAALSMRERTDRAQFIAAFSGSHRFILDYLIEQVLSQQTREIESFLLNTAILERMNAALCHAVTGQTDTQGRLEWLEAHNLFVIPLDDARQWYRYHPLFADVLRHRLRQTAPAEVAGLHIRASAWYETHGQYADAVHHALAAHDPETVARIIEQVGIQIALGGQPQTVAHWVAALPEELIRERPMVACADAVVNTLMDRLGLAGERLETAERTLIKSGNSAQLRLVQTWQAVYRGEVALQCGNLEGFVAASREGLLTAAPGEPARLPLLVRVARAYQLTGDVLVSAEQIMAETVPIVRASNNLFTLLNSIVYLARLQSLQGRLRQAAETYAQAAQAMPSAAGQTVHVIHPVYYSGLADILREWDRLDEAASLCAQGLELTHTTLSVDADALMLAYTTHVRIHLARGELNDARLMVSQLEKLAAERELVPVMLAQVTALRALVDLARGDLDAAVDWAKGRTFSASDMPDFVREFEMLTWARVWLADARHANKTAQLKQVAGVLERWCEDAQTKGRINSVIEILVLRALTAEAQGERAEALSFLERALVPGEPENYLRVFADEGTPMRRLLLAFRNGSATLRSAYLASILDAFHDRPEPETKPAREPHAALPGALSARERQVLGLVVNGASNREIAQELVISLSTVKAHTNTIYAKLGVTSRSQAIRRAHELNLV